jgi:Asp-tRNA(Asn)/Glu-tRNA(Gln) amidotransferase A subunit family amidase
MQLIGPQFAEELILNAAYKYEQENPLVLTKKPKI